MLQIGRYTLYTEIWHTDDWVNEEAHVHQKDTYYLDNKPVKRSEVPKDILEKFDDYSEKEWYSYESPNFPSR